MPHIVLLGDSIFDNAAYTGTEPDVVTHLRRILPAGWRATLAAVDGATASGIARQLQNLPRDATHVVLAAGGNDALANLDLLSTRVRSTAEALALFGRRRDMFAADYRAAVTAVLRQKLPVTLCTIYNGLLPEPDGGLARTALTFFNDVILQVAFERGCRLIELRLVCSQPEDYAIRSSPPDAVGRGSHARLLVPQVRCRAGPRP